MNLLPLDDEVVEYFLNYPVMDVMPNLITMLSIQEHQFNDVQLQICAYHPLYSNQVPQSLCSESASIVFQCLQE